jgi:hypothetical protein
MRRECAARFGALGYLHKGKRAENAAIEES